MVPMLTPEPTKDPTPSSLPRFEPARCQFVNSYLHDAECGYLLVPEDRTSSDSSIVRLHVAIFRSDHPNSEPDPAIYLAGGGGANLLDSAGYYLKNGGYEILQNRDYIMYNQRGAQYNNPSLECPGFNKFAGNLAGMELSSEEYHARKLEFLLDCRDDLRARGIDLDHYNTAVNAADLNDLRIALGYEHLNLYGTSYGTRLALTYMREHPEHVRSVIIDSVFPPQVDYFSENPVNAFRAFQKLFESCAADERCRDLYPNLELVFYNVVDQLDDTPAQIPWNDGPIVFNGGVFAEAIYMMLYAADIASAPKAISDAAAGDFSVLEPYILGAMEVTFSSINWGAYYSIFCSEEALVDSLDHAIALSTDLPARIADHFVWTGPSSASYSFSLCKSWGVRAADQIESKPVVSSIPTLMFAGQFDPITPIYWARLAAQTLSNSFFYELPGLGHGVMRSNPCALDIGLQFMADPTVEPDASCIAGLTGPEFD